MGYGVLINLYVVNLTWKLLVTHFYQRITILLSQFKGNFKLAVNIAPLSLAIIILITTTYTSWGVQLLKNNDCLDMCTGLEWTMQENHHLRWVAKKELPPYLYNNQRDGMMKRNLIVTSIEKNHRNWQNLSHLLDNVILVHLHMCNY